MPVVHQGNALVHIHRRVGKGKFRAARRIGLHADAENLAFNAGFYFFEVIGLLQDLVNGLTIAYPRSHPVSRNILESIPGPDIHHTRLAQFFRQVTADADTGFAVFDPEFSGFLVRAGQRQRVAHRMGEEGGIEVTAQAAFLAELRPLSEVFRLQFVSVCPFPVFENGIAGMQVHLRCTGNQAQHLVQVRHQLFRGACTARIIARGLDSAGQRFARIGIKAPHVVTLPAVQGHRYPFQFFNGCVGINADSRIAFSGFFVAHASSPPFLIWIMIFPSAVASIGSAITFLPVASSVSRFRYLFLAPPPTMYSF